MAQGAVRSEAHPGVPRHQGTAQQSRPLSFSPRQPQAGVLAPHGAGPPRWRSHAVRQLVTVQVPLQLQEARQLHPRLAVHTPALAPLPIQRRVTLWGWVWSRTPSLDPMANPMATRSSHRGFTTPIPHEAFVKGPHHPKGNSHQSQEPDRLCCALSLSPPSISPIPASPWLYKMPSHSPL